ncbi:hypothetical protein [Ammoniphilus sp. 3BR4]|uniref:hypothetical protein n=1 Tax=Ammoniphilus sp. 3BR4 TaxID=3158265 RepID=UPI003466C6E9
MTKKKKPNTPRRKRYNQQARLQNAKNWISKYGGKNIVRGYSKWFGVDLLCAIKELELLGHHIDEHYKQQVKLSLEARQEHRRRQKEKKGNERDMEWLCGDETFYFIAGYTSNGVPFGITHKEMEEIDLTKEGMGQSMEKTNEHVDDDNLPF